MTIHPPSHLQYLRELHRYGKETGVTKAIIMDMWRKGLPRLKSKDWKAVAWFDQLLFVSEMQLSGKGNGR